VCAKCGCGKKMGQPGYGKGPDKSSKGKPAKPMPKKK
jgi:hypothetical protein